MSEFVILSKQDAEREKRNARYNPAIDCGAKGRIFENRNARPKSNKVAQEKTTTILNIMGVMLRQKARRTAAGLTAC